VAAAGRQAKFVPATRDGAAVDVYMLLMVRIDISDREPQVLVLPNNGVESERYGLYYIAPQRFNEFTWPSGQRAVRSGRALIWQKLRIDGATSKASPSRCSMSSLCWTSRECPRGVQRKSGSGSFDAIR
jgi:hypothetical protein